MDFTAFCFILWRHVFIPDCNLKPKTNWTEYLLRTKVAQIMSNRFLTKPTRSILCQKYQLSSETNNAITVDCEEHFNMLWPSLRRTKCFQLFGD